VSDHEICTGRQSTTGWGRAAIIVRSTVARPPLSLPVACKLTFAVSTGIGSLICGGAWRGRRSLQEPLNQLLSRWRVTTARVARLRSAAVDGLTDGAVGLAGDVYVGGPCNVRRWASLTFNADQRRACSERHHRTLSRCLFRRRPALIWRSYLT